MRATASSAPSSPAVAVKGRIRRTNEARILRAAEAVFARAGYEGARMADIAERARMPKANLHYYFRTKQEIYHAVLDGILALWLRETELIAPEREPAQALADYIRAKMRLSRARPDASRIFATEVIRGAPHLGKYLRSEMKELIDRKARVIDGWVAQGRLAPLNARHLFITLWGATQTYADFAAQASAILGARRLTSRHLEEATEQLVGIVVRGCGAGAVSPIK